MARLARKCSDTGIYHVMVRGVNHQSIFKDTEDYYQFINTLDRMRIQYDDEGLPCGVNCIYYAYCLMSNHFHLLIREKGENVGDTIKRIAGSYVYYYNHKYLRDGHLFKERFKSEPVNDMEYFTTLLRYIHQNPLKAGMVRNVNDYRFSSWGEYTGAVEPVFQICDTAAVLKRISFNNLSSLVYEDLPNGVNCLDYDEKALLKLSDDQVGKFIADTTGVTDICEVKLLEKKTQRELLRELRRMGASIRQLERLTGISRGVIQAVS